MANVEQTAQGTMRGVAARAAKMKKLHIQKVDNGYVVTQTHAPGGRGGTAKPKRHVFPTYEAARDYVSDTMQGYKD